ncbi:hypothetical protein M431DRAFT_416406 [Trichoderma harzianum CBS 226.95]|uniref:Uncharacterized protein n=1 Tax=Trichoderma harzianum CBS 226.95 TaxID=983964 RepID=A0A2T4AG44_TRIHA|nr:hypothetical protein M431DRAFT_416406 [Trichoderma harzianum CBS 226.95]PTB56055.1 hypothetical protein M431DRAFT_416406 [Trichoderma harzianum CBS 226.95]
MPCTTTHSSGIAKSEPFDSGDLKAKCQRIASNPAPGIVYQYIHATIPVQYGVQRVENLSPEGREGKAKKSTKKRKQQGRVKKKKKKKKAEKGRELGIRAGLLILFCCFIQFKRTAALVCVPKRPK